MKRMILVLMTIAAAGWTGAANGGPYVTYPEYRDSMPPVRDAQRDSIRRSAAPSIRSIAGEMTKATSDLYGMAAGEAQTFGDSQALEDLRKLNMAAERFERDAARVPDPANNARPAYRMLIDAHQFASKSIGQLEPSPAVFAQFRRVDKLMAELIEDMA
jgi:hypothetical protein